MRKRSKSGRVHTCEQCGKRDAWGPGWIWLIAPVASKHPGENGQEMPVRFCSDACETAWLETETGVRIRKVQR